MFRRMIVVVLAAMMMASPAMAGHSYYRARVVRQRQCLPRPRMCFPRPPRVCHYPHGRLVSQPYYDYYGDGGHRYYRAEVVSSPAPVTQVITEEVEVEVTTGPVQQAPACQPGQIIWQVGMQTGTTHDFKWTDPRTGVLMEVDVDHKTGVIEGIEVD